MGIELIRVSVDELDTFVVSAFEAMGVPADEARLCATA